jgi:type VI protein secretion system component VasK
MLKLYFDDFIAQWDGFLRDVTLAPLTDQSRPVIEQLRGASENLRDLASADSALRRLLTAIVRETNLARVEEEPPTPPLLRPARASFSGASAPWAASQAKARATSRRRRNGGGQYHRHARHRALPATPGRRGGGRRASAGAR